MRYSDRIIEDVQAASDIVEIINQYVPLKRSGRNFKGLCPFHQEKTPSFMVNIEKQIFHCFGCSVGGDVFSFLMRYENMTFPEAVRTLAERAHIHLPELTSSHDDEDKGIERLYEAYRLAMEYYRAQYLHPERGKAARAYFCKRGFDEAMAEEFKVGWALADWQGLYDFLSKKGFDEELLVKSRLIQKSSQGRCYDIFRSRLLFPIRNLQGKIVGFGGRLIDETEGPKYLNSPENPIFHKRRELFGLYAAKKFIDREKPQIIIVEGYLDFLRLYAAGFKSSVATLGTALTNDHVQVLKRFADEAVVIYDGDKAGEAASLRGLEVFLEEGMNVKLVRMPKGFDPDDFVLKQGAEAFRKLLESARDFFDYKLEISLQRHNRNDSLGLMRITEDFLSTLSKIKHPILQDIYVRRLGNVLHVDEQTLRSELTKVTKKSTPLEYPGKNGSDRRVPVREAKVKHEAVSGEEITVLALMMDDPEVVKIAEQSLTPADFPNSDCRALFEWFLTMDTKFSANRQAKVLSHVRDENLKARLVAVASLELSAEGRQKAFEDCFKKMKKQVLNRRLEELRRNITKAEQEGDQKRVKAYIKEYQELIHPAK